MLFFVSLVFGIREDILSEETALKTFSMGRLYVHVCGLSMEDPRKFPEVVLEF